MTMKLTNASVDSEMLAPLVEAGALAIPNLDDMTTEDAEVDAMGDVFAALASYCKCKGAAMRHRKAGRLHEALAMERTCEQRYAALPTSLQW